MMRFCSNFRIEGRILVLQAQYTPTVSQCRNIGGVFESCHVSQSAGSLYAQITKSPPIKRRDFEICA